MLLAHLPSVAWALGIVTIGWRCPLTNLENAFRERAGRSTHEVGFIDAYLTGIVYPERFLPVLQGLVAVSVLTSYALLARQRRGTGALAG